MRKKYVRPKLSIETMDFSLLLETSNIRIGGKGSFDAKEISSYFDDEEDEEDYE